MEKEDVSHSSSEGELKDIFCWSGYSGRVGANFSNQIQYEYSGVNILDSIEGISLENFSASQHHSSL